MILRYSAEVYILSIARSFPTASPNIGKVGNTQKLQEFILIYPGFNGRVVGIEKGNTTLCNILLTNIKFERFMKIFLQANSIYLEFRP